VNLALVARSASLLEEVRTEVVALGVKAAAIPADVTVSSQRDGLVRRATAEILVNDVPMRPLLTMAAALPGLTAPVMQLIGLTDMMRRAAEMSSGRS